VTPARLLVNEKTYVDICPAILHHPGMAKKEPIYTRLEPEDVDRVARLCEAMTTVHIKVKPAYVFHAMVKLALPILENDYGITSPGAADPMRPKAKRGGGK
jgi:hypothetical protein